MSRFNAEIALNVQSNGAERQVRKIEAAVGRVERASQGILSIDKQILGERRKLLTLSGQQADRAKKRVADLRLQRSELSLQRRELQSIASLERKRAAALNRVANTGGGSGDSGGGGAAALAGIGGFAATSALARQKKSFDIGVDVGQLKQTRKEIAFELNEVEELVRKETADLEMAFAKYRDVVARRGPNATQAQSSRNFLRLRIDRNRGIRQRESNLSGALDANANAIRDAEAAQAQLNAAAERASNPLNNLGRQLAGAAAAYVSVDQAVRQVVVSIRKATEAASSEQRIRALSDGFDNYAAVLGVAERAAAKFNLSTIESQDGVAQLYGRLRPLGLTLSEIETVFNGFNTAAALTGATAAESAGAMLQLSQALGAGALRGEEFNSISEQAPGIIQAIAKELDVPVGRLKSMAKEGQLTSDIVIAALRRVEREGADKLAAALDAPAQKFKTLENRIGDLQIAFGELALPTVLSLVDRLTKRTEAWAKAVQGLEVVFTQLANSPGVKELYRIAQLMERISKFNPINPFGPIGAGGIRGALVDQLGRFAPTKQTAPTPQNSTVPLRTRLGIEPFTPVTTGGSTGSGKSAAQREQERLDQLLKDQLEAGSEIERQLKREAQLRAATNDLEREKLQINFDAIDLMRRINTEAAPDQRAGLLELAQQAEVERLSAAVANNEKARAEAIRNATSALYDENELLQATLDGREEEVRLRIEARNVARDIEGLEEDDVLAILNKNKALRERVEILNANRRALEGVVNGVGTEMAGLFETLITGTDDFNKVLQDTLLSLSKLLFKAGINALGGNDGVGLFSILSGNFGGGRASGGPVSSTKSYVVGERGPELFVPGRSGTIVPNGAGGDVVVNAPITIENKGGGELDPAAAARLAKTVQGVVMSTLTREKRPGGLLTR